MEQTKNLILGTAWGYKKEQVAIFVESWKEHCSQHQLLLLVEPDVSQDKIDWLLDMGVDVRFFTAGYFVPSAIHNTRYFKYLDILLEGRGHYDKVFLTDVRDVVFQGDIFAEIDANGLHAFREDLRYNCTERFNKYILTTNYGEALAAEFANLPIICSGTTLGDAESIMQYIVALMNERDLKKMAELGGIPDEQACHNFIFHRNLLPHVQHDTGDGVATICLTALNHPQDIEILDSGLISVQGQTPAVVHQFDRHPPMIDYLTNRYLKGKNYGI